MRRDEPLPLTEQVEEIRAESDDRITALVVPALERSAAWVCRQAAIVRERFSRLSNNRADA
jgi:hypothetical protein